MLAMVHRKSVQGRSILFRMLGTREEGGREVMGGSGMVIDYVLFF